MTATAQAPKNSWVNELTASQQTPACAFLASVWALYLHLCHLVQSGTRDCSKTSYLSPLVRQVLASPKQQSSLGWLPSPHFQGNLWHVPPHQQPTRYAKSTSSTEMRKRCKKSCLSVSCTVDPAHLWWVWSPKRSSLCSGTAWASTKEMKRRNKTSEQPNLVWTACIHYSKDGFLLVPPPYPPPQWWQQEAWHSNYRIFTLNREEGQLVGSRYLGYGIQGSMQPAETWRNRLKLL